MDLATYSNALVSGLLTGLVYGLSALGLAVIFGVIRIVNFAHGELMVVGMFMALVLFRLAGIDPMLAIPVAVIVLFVIGYMLERYVVSRVSHLPEHMQFMLLAAIAIVMVSGLLLMFGPDAQGVSNDLPYALDSIAMGDLIIDLPRLYAAIGAVVVATVLLGFFRFSRTGKAIRACADNKLGAEVVGLNVGRLYALTFGIGAASLGAAGCIILMLVDVHPYLAPQYTLLAFVIVIIGGMGSLYGALLGGILIGFSEAILPLGMRDIFGGLFGFDSLGTWLGQPSLKTAYSYALLIIVLLLRPQGLLGKSS